MKVVVGCDGGGTKTIAKAVVLSPDGRVIAQGEGHRGPGNIRVDCELACQNITSAVKAALLDANRGAEQGVDVLVCGLAGAGTDVARKAAAARLAADLEIDHFKIITDIELVMVAAELETNCVALVAGTGSIAWARDSRGGSHRAGGLGPSCGDEGSGHWIGEQVRFALRDLGDDSPLLRRLLEQFGTQRRDDFSRQLMFADRPVLASIARHVFASCAEETVAAKIIDRSAKYLAGLVCQVGRQANLDTGEVPWAVAGGVLIAQPEFVKRIASYCAEQAMHLQPARVVETPVEGAVKLARQIGQ